MPDPSASRPGSGSSGHSGSSTGKAASTPRWRRTRLRQTLIVVGSGLLVLAAILGIGGTILVHRYENAVGRGNLLDPGARTGSGSVTGPLNLLLIGSDQRAGNPDAGERSDTIIVAHVNRALNKAYLVSVPRDLLVDIPPMPSVNFTGDKTKINAAFEYGKGGAGGTRLVSATLTQLLGVKFDAAAVIDFSGLKSAVDLLGGVNMCVDSPVKSIHTGKVFEPGCQLMSSTDVLDYLRQRDFPDGDYGRQRHQQQFLKAFLDRARTTGAASNPVKLDGLVRAVAGTMTVDTGEAGLTELVFGLRDLRPGSLAGIKIPSSPEEINNVSYVVTSADAAGLFEALRSDGMDQWAQSHPQWVNKI
jgi:LCP family protein required for cell wall assembly